MRFCYGDKNILRILEEAEFWKRQEAEHTVVIRELVPDLEQHYVDKLEESMEVFNSTEATITQYIENIISNPNIDPCLEEKINALIKVTICQSQIFVKFLGDMISNSSALEDNLTAIVVINHIRRESEYYIGIAKAYMRL
jgi:hypothetical protein